MAVLRRPGLLTTGLVIVAIIGFTFQVVQVSVLYFRFKTSTHVSFETPEFLETHSAALCIRFTDIIDKERLFKETGIRLQDTRTLEEGMRQSGKLTVDQVFEYTPQENETIVSCVHRPDEWSIERIVGPDCYKVFRVRKFFMLEYICYIADQVSDHKMRVEAVVQSMFAKGIIFTVLFNQSFSEMDRVLPIAFGPGWPIVSRDHAPVQSFVKDRPKKGNTKKFALIVVTPSDLSVHLLPRPYDTDCFQVTSDTNLSGCRQRCLLQAFAPFQRVPGTEILTTRHKLKPLTTADVMDPIQGPAIRELHQNCVSRCRRRACNSGYSVTSVGRSMTTGETVRLNLAAPLHSKVVITAQPSMLFIEYFSLVCSCFGTWFGLSFLSLKELTRRNTRQIRRPAAIARQAWTAPAPRLPC